MKAKRHAQKASLSSDLGPDEQDSSQTSFDFSSDDDYSSASSDEESFFSSRDVLTSRDFLKCPPAPLLRYESPPETPTRDGTPLPGTPTGGRRPAMRLDLSSLPSPFRLDTSRLAASSPRPSLSSRFSSDEQLSARAAEGVTPGTENAWSAFGIAAGRRLSPSGGLLPSPQASPLLRTSSRQRRQRFFDSPEVEKSPRAPTSPLQHLCASAAPALPEPALAAPRSTTPSLVDFRMAKAIVHSLLPGSHALLAEGDTPALTLSTSADSYFAIR